MVFAITVNPAVLKPASGNVRMYTLLAIGMTAVDCDLGNNTTDIAREFAKGDAPLTFVKLTVMRFALALGADPVLIYMIPPKFVPETDALPPLPTPAPAPDP